MITIKKSLNSSIVLVERDDREMILIGKGIGYGKKPGMSIELNQIDQVFLPVEDQKAQRLLSLMDAIPAVYFDLTQAIIRYGEEYSGAKLSSSLFLTLTEHLHFAVERARKGIDVINRVYWEIKNYYPQEYHIGEYAQKLLEESMQVRLPKEEAANIAFHLMNARSGAMADAMDRSDGMQMAKMIGSIGNLIQYSLHIQANMASVHYSRFITHMKFFAERFFSGQLIDDGDDALFTEIATLYPQAMNAAFKIRDYVHEVYGGTIPNDELTYLAVHLYRLLHESSVS